MAIRSSASSFQNDDNKHEVEYLVWHDEDYRQWKTSITFDKSENKYEENAYMFSPTVTADFEAIDRSDIPEEFLDALDKMVEESKDSVLIPEKTDSMFVKYECGCIGFAPNKDGEAIILEACDDDGELELSFYRRAMKNKLGGIRKYRAFSEVGTGQMITKIQSVINDGIKFRKIRSLLN
jgi:hypothetical protein